MAKGRFQSAKGLFNQSMRGPAAVAGMRCWIAVRVWMSVVDVLESLSTIAAGVVEQRLTYCTGRDRPLLTCCS